MIQSETSKSNRSPTKPFKPKQEIPIFWSLLILALFSGGLIWLLSLRSPARPQPKDTSAEPKVAQKPLNYLPREQIDETGYASIFEDVAPLPPTATSKEVAKLFGGTAKKRLAEFEKELERPDLNAVEKFTLLFSRARYANFDGDPDKAYESLRLCREILEKYPRMAEEALYTIIYYQGLTSLRKAENDNCIMCRDESSCILPFSEKAQHKNRLGSENAVKHFEEYLEKFPDDLAVKWLYNIAHMTLGQYPDKVPQQYRISLAHFENREAWDLLPVFRDIGIDVGLNRLNQSGGAIMDDFDNDGFLDVVVSSFDPTQVMGFFKNLGNGRFEERTKEAGLSEQFGGLNCMQTDYNNDGLLDVLVVRGAWLQSKHAMRPSLLRNNGDGTFTDVTDSAGLAYAVNSIAAGWADYDHDGWLDLFICCEQQLNRLYHNNGDGTFTEVSAQAGVAGSGQFYCKGIAWIDYDNDGWPDLYLNHLSPEGGQLFRNNRNGTFTKVTSRMGISGPMFGFSCWAWDFDNDGWLDIFATCYDRTLESLVKSLTGNPHGKEYGRLYRNKQGQGFEDVTRQFGLDGCYATMGSNFGDLNNDGFLDIYLGTGEPNFSALIPNLTFLNQGGQKFINVTAPTRMGNIQKGHGVSIGDWNNDGHNDVFIQMGGAVDGDKYHNILFHNPGNDKAWITLKLVGEKTNKAAIGARIKIVTRGPNPQTIHRLVSTGSSFGANSLRQTIGLGDAEEIELLEITWPTSGTTQTFTDVPIKKSLRITEFAETFEEVPYVTIAYEKPQS